MYPTKEAVYQADIVLLCRWTRFLESPGWSAIGTPEFNERLKEEANIMNHILKRQKELGGWTPEISKLVGW
jgi:hypothetical protein